MIDYEKLDENAGKIVIEACGSYDNFTKIFDKGWVTEAEAELKSIVSKTLKCKGDWLGVDERDYEFEIEDLIESGEKQFAWDDRYQCYYYYFIPEFKSEIEKILWAMERAVSEGYDGVTQYATLLEDSGVASEGYYQISALIPKLKEELKIA